MATSSSLSSSIAIALLLLCFCGSAGLAANPSKGPICDVTADHYLALEDYPVAIRLHREFLQKHSANALAHYHLGFAYGMTGDEMQELHEYQHAIALGLSRWDLFLNTGVAFLGSGNLPAATGALQRAVQLDPSQPESHYNLGLVYERRGMLPEAEREMLSTLRLEPNELDARNMLGLVYARQGKKAEASAQWTALLREAPEYSQARTNLAILQGKAVEGHGDAFVHAAATPSLSQAHESAPITVEDVLGKP
jgi:tetratricopeptide (TPR) repeat protein